jgi:hypothetical protein
MICHWWYQNTFLQCERSNPDDEVDAEPPLPSPVTPNLAKVQYCGQDPTTRYNARLQNEFARLNASEIVFDDFSKPERQDAGWQLIEDVPGKIGWINNNTLDARLVFRVTCGAQHTLVLFYLKTYEHAGILKLWWTADTGAELPPREDGTVGAGCSEKSAFLVDSWWHWHATTSFPQAFPCPTELKGTIEQCATCTYTISLYFSVYYRFRSP